MVHLLMQAIRYLKPNNLTVLRGMILYLKENFGKYGNNRLVGDKKICLKTKQKIRQKKRF